MMKSKLKTVMFSSEVERYISRALSLVRVRRSLPNKASAASDGSGRKTALTVQARTLRSAAANRYVTGAHLVFAVSRTLYLVRRDFR